MVARVRSDSATRLDERVRNAHGVAGVRRLTRHALGVAVHVLDFDVAPGRSWHQLSWDTLDSVSIVLGQIGGRVETRLTRDASLPDGPCTMSFAPRATMLWGYTDAIRRVYELRIDFDATAFLTRVDERLQVPRSPQFLRDERLRTLAAYLASECEQPGPGSQLYIESLMTTLCLDTMRQAAASGRRSPRLAPWQLRRVTECLHEDLTTSIGLEELASMVGLSVSWFGKAFKAATGMTPYQWQLNARIERARALLSDGQSQAEVALATGFSEQSHFCRVFKQHAGMTPGVWQRMHRRRETTTG